MTDSLVGRRISPRLWATVALVGGWLFFFREAIFSTKVFYLKDLLMTEIPLRYYLRERLAAGDLPQWYPYEMMGTPFAGIVIASFFHPRTLLFLFLSTSASTKWSLLLGYLVGLVGGYRLARVFGASRVAALTGAWVLALSGCAISYGNKTNMLMGLVAVPWMLASVWRLTKRDDLRDVVSLGVWWALIFLGGDPRIFIECAVVGAFLLLAGGLRPLPFVRFAMGGALAVLLAGAELMPALGLNDDSIRSHWKQTTTLARMWALHPLRLAELVLPNFIPDSVRPAMGQVLETREEFFVEWIFVGGAVMTLAALGALRRWPGRVVWGATAIFGAWLATGYFGGLVEVLWKVIPYLAKFRYPEKYMGIVAVALAPLVAAGVDSALTLPRRGRIATLAVGGALVLLGIVAPADSMATWALNLTGVTQTIDPTMFHTLSSAWASGLIRTGMFVLVLGGALWALQFERRAFLAIPAIVFVEIWSANGDHLKLVAEKTAESVGPIARALNAQRKPGEPPPRVFPGRIEYDREQLPPEQEVHLAHLSLDADDSGRSHVSAVEVNEPGQEARVLRTYFGIKGLDLGTWAPRLNTCYRVGSVAGPIAVGEEPLTREYDRGLLLLKEPCLDRAFLARAEPVDNPDDAKARMKDGLDDDLVVWEGGPKVEKAGGTVEWVDWQPESLKLKVDATIQSALVISEAYAKGWSATLDGQPAPIFPTNAASRGMLIPAGKHAVEMHYHAPWRAAGLLFSLLGLLGCAGLVYFARGRASLPATVRAAPPTPFPVPASIPVSAPTPVPTSIPAAAAHPATPETVGPGTLSTRDVVNTALAWLEQIPPRWGACLAIAGAWVIFFGVPPLHALMGTTTESAGSIIFSSKVLFDRDLMLTELPLRDYMAERLLSGHLPQWYPYEIMGLPFSGSLVANPFHPQALLHLIFSAPVAMKWRIILAYLFGLIGMYRLTRSFGASRVAAVAGGCAFAFSGYIISMNNDVPFLMPLATSPWMVAAAWRLHTRRNLRDVVALGFWWALVFYGGDPQLFLECGLISLALLLAAERPWVGLGDAFERAGVGGVVEALLPKAIARFVVGGVLAGLLAAAELMPALALRHEFERETWKETKALAGTWAVHPFRFPDFLVPRFVPDAWREQMGALQNPRLDYFAFSLFIGSSILLLAIAGLWRKAPRRMVWLVTLMLAFWLCTGLYGGFIEIWWKIAPPFAKFRYPEKYNAVIDLALGPVVAAGVDAVRRGNRIAGLVAMIAGGIVLGAGLFVPAASLQSSWVHLFGMDANPKKLIDPAMAQAWGENWSHGLVQTGLILLAMGYVLRAITRDHRWILALPAIVFADLWLGNSGRIPLVTKAVEADVGPLTRALAAQQRPNEPPVRVYSGKASLAIDRLAPDDRIARVHDLVYADDAGRGHVAPFDINSPAEEWRVMRTFFGRSASVVGDWVGQFGICYRVITDGATQGEASKDPDEEVIPNASEGGYTLVKHHCLPRAFLASAETVPESPDKDPHGLPVSFEQAQGRMKTGLALNHVVWEGGPVVDQGSGTVAWKKAEPEYLEMEVDAQTDSALVVTEAYAKGWSATIDGVDTRIYPTSAVIRGVFVPKGRHVVRMNYNAPWLNLGLLLSTLGLALSAVILWRARIQPAAG